MLKTKHIVLICLATFLTILAAMYFVDKLNEPVFISPETAEFIHLNKGYSPEDAKAIRVMCEQNGCSLDENGNLLLNSN